MREILFRGKDQNGKWYEGQLIKNKLGYFISTEENPHYCSEYGYIELDNPIKVKPETVGQFTGLTDKNGVKVFEDSIINYLGSIGVVFYDKDTAMYMVNFKLHKSNWSFDSMDEPFEIIGNIHDNPEYLK